MSLLRKIKNKDPNARQTEAGRLKNKMQALITHLRTIKQKVGNKKAQKKGKDRKWTVKHDTQGYKLQNKTGND